MGWINKWKTTLPLTSYGQLRCTHCPSRCWVCFLVTLCHVRCSWQIKNTLTWKHKLGRAFPVPQSATGTAVFWMLLEMVQGFHGLPSAGQSKFCLCFSEFRIVLFLLACEFPGGITPISWYRAQLSCKADLDYMNPEQGLQWWWWDRIFLQIHRYCSPSGGLVKGEDKTSMSNLERWLNCVDCVSSVNVRTDSKEVYESVLSPVKFYRRSFTLYLCLHRREGWGSGQRVSVITLNKQDLNDSGRGYFHTTF